MEPSQQRAEPTEEQTTKKVSECQQPQREEAIQEEVVEEEQESPVHVHSKVRRDLDDELEEMRQRALESMRRGSVGIEEPARDDRKLIIPLNEDSSDEDDTDVDEGGAKETPNGSSDVSLSSEEDATDTPVREEPRFVVTMKGIDKGYFKRRASGGGGQEAIKEGQPKKKEEQTKPALVKVHLSETAKAALATVTFKSAEPDKCDVAPTSKAEIKQATPSVIAKPTAPVVGQKRTLASPLTTTAITPKKPEAKVAPLVKSQPVKLQRARITAPESNKLPQQGSLLEVKKRALATSTTVFSPMPVPVSGGQRDVCRFWPRCRRGDTCFYYHPKSQAPATAVKTTTLLAASKRVTAVNRGKFKWSSASIAP